MTLDDSLLSVILPLCMLLLLYLFSFVVAFVISQIGGWAELSRYYRAANPFDGQRWRFQSADMRSIAHYHGCLTLGINTQCLHLATFFLFRPFHPPLLIPWQDISVRTGKIFWWQWTEFRFRQAPSVYLRIYGRLGGKISSAAGASWPGDKTFG